MVTKYYLGTVWVIIPKAAYNRRSGQRIPVPFGPLCQP